MDASKNLFVQLSLAMIERFVNAPEKTGAGAELALKAMRFLEGAQIPADQRAPLDQAARALTAFRDAGAPRTAAREAVEACTRAMATLGWENRGRGGGVPAIGRDELFGALPLAATEASTTFGDAAAWLHDGRRDEALAELRAVATGADLDSSLRAQAWHLLREMGVRPSDAEGHEILGVVVEVAFANGKSDVVSAWADHRARYWDYSGLGVVWEEPAGTDKTVDDSIERALDLSRGLIALEPRAVGTLPAAPIAPDIRITVITPRGFHSLLGPYVALGSLRMTPVSAGVLVAVQVLMVRLRDLAQGEAASRRSMPALTSRASRPSRFPRCRR